MSLPRFPILLTSTLIIAATALLAPADAAEQRSFWGFLAPHVDVEVSVGRACPPPVCAQPVPAPPIREIVWVDGFTTCDAYGCRSWVPGHYEERYRVQPGYRQPAPRCPEPASRFPEHGGPWHHDDDRGRGRDDDRYRGQGDDRGPGHHDAHGPVYRR